MKARIKLSFNDLRKVLSVWNRSFEIGRVIFFDAFILLFFPIFFFSYQSLYRVLMFFIGLLFINGKYCKRK